LKHKDIKNTDPGKVPIITLIDKINLFGIFYLLSRSRLFSHFGTTFSLLCLVKNTMGAPTVNYPTVVPAINQLVDVVAKRVVGKLIG
jgi:hypothetical protein